MRIYTQYIEMLVFSQIHDTTPTLVTNCTADADIPALKNATFACFLAPAFDLPFASRRRWGLFLFKCLIISVYDKNGSEVLSLKKASLEKRTFLQKYQ